VFICVQQGVVDKLFKKANMSLVVGTSSWREQFIDAVSISPGKESMIVMFALAQVREWRKN